MKTTRPFPLRNNGQKAKKSILPSVVQISQRGRRLQLRSRDTKDPFSPPEDWYEPTESGESYKIIVQDPGPGYRHVLTPDQVRDRLAQLPQSYLSNLEVVQFSRMTRKKQSFPCYGMQWGAALYLYPLEESREELFFSPPRPEIVNEAKMYGGRWDRPDDFTWRLSWSDAAIEDFYLNNILIHELGHLLDNRNTNYTDRERYAEWFAIQHGYLASGGRSARKKLVRRRHHGC